MSPKLSQTRYRVMLPPNLREEMYKEANEHLMPFNDYIILMLSNRIEINYRGLTQFRIKLDKRIRKGIDEIYLFELKRLYNYLGNILSKLD